MIKKILSGKLFQQSLSEPTPIEIIIWWEKRRFHYNMVVGFIGLLALLICGGLESVFYKAFERTSIHLPDPLLFAIIIYCLISNILYSLGGISEIIARKIWKEKARNFGKKTLLMGFSISIILTLMPVFLFVAIVLSGM